MGLKHLFSWLKRTSRRGAKSGDGLLRDSEMFHQLIQRERMRCDRTQGVCSLLVFTLVEADRHEGVTQLETLLNQRLRLTDEKGFVDRLRIGALLPETQAAGARALAEQICQTYAADGAKSIVYEVYVYPTNWHGEDEFDKTNKADESAETRPVSVSAAHDERPLETLFVRRMPVWKRALDILGASVGLILAAPFLLVAAVLIKLTSRGPVFFTQKRAGLGGKPFTMYKLRTMEVDAEARKAELRQYSEQDGPAFKMTNDPRITPIGRVLRTTCVDELPQLWNVLIGDMSLVGPRPLPCDESDQCRGWERRRLEATPGLTCLWQVHGGRHVTFAEWMRMDIRYINGRTIKQDLKLLCETAVAVIKRRASC